MSAIALAWVASIKVGNATAKSLLRFLASHNFNSDKYEFKISTLASQLEITARTVQLALDLLITKSFITRTPRFDKSGRQISNCLTLNIPSEFVDNFMGEGEARSPLGVKHVHPEGEARSPLRYNEVNNNKINNKLNSKLEKKSDRKNQRSAIPENFEPTPEHVNLAIELNVDLVEQVKIFIDYYLATGKKMIKWDAAFRNWLRKASDFKKSSATARVTYQNKNEIKSTVPDFVPGSIHKRSSKTVVAANMEKIRKKLGSVLRETK